MKKIFNILPVVAVALAFVSCNSTMDDKDEIDAKYVVGTAPTVAIANAAGGSSAVTVSGTVSDASKVVEVGVRVSSTEDMADPAYWPAAVVANEFTAVAKKLQPLTAYYIQVYSVAKDNQMTFSAVQRVSTGEPEFGIAQLNGNVYTGATTAYWGDNYTFNFSLQIDSEDSTKVKVLDFDPFMASNEFYSTDGYNIYEGVIDWENKVIILEAGQETGYKDTFIVGMDNPDPNLAENYDNIYLDVEAYGETVVIRNACGVMSEGGWYELYFGGITLNKK